jgi:molecular chaperone GrpE
MTSSDIPTPAQVQAAAGETPEADSTPDRGAAVDAGGDEAAAAIEPGPPTLPEAEVAALRDRWLRAEAELQNYRRRAQRDLEEARRGAEERALLDVIEFLDDLERALSAAREAGGDAAWVQGVELVAQRMRDSLARAGVSPISPTGEAFDPRVHEALLELPAPEGATPGTVVQVLRTGYRRGERVLRAARVAVAAEPAGSG